MKITKLYSYETAHTLANILFLQFLNHLQAKKEIDIDKKIKLETENHELSKQFINIEAIGFEAHMIEDDESIKFMRPKFDEEMALLREQMKNDIATFPDDIQKIVNGMFGGKE
jgi:hypothetical protein